MFKEIIAGATTFFAIFTLSCKPQMLSQAGVPYGGVFQHNYCAIIGTLVMGLFVNVPYAQAPGMGLNAFFVYTVVFMLVYLGRS